LNRSLRTIPILYLWKKLKFYSTMKNTELARACGLSIELKKVNMMGPVHFWLLRPTTFRKYMWEKE